LSAKAIHVQLLSNVFHVWVPRENPTIGLARLDVNEQVNDDFTWRRRDLVYEVRLDYLSFFTNGTGGIFLINIAALYVWATS
jgi:hypothetical protein